MSNRLKGSTGSKRFLSCNCIACVDDILSSKFHLFSRGFRYKSVIYSERIKTTVAEEVFTLRIVFEKFNYD